MWNRRSLTEVRGDAPLAIGPRFRALAIERIQRLVEV
jgi:hypothetical protein